MRPDRLVVPAAGGVRARFDEAAHELGSVLDAEQRPAADRLAVLGAQLTAARTSAPWAAWRRHRRPTGIYLHGPVGRGKTWLVDVLIDQLPAGTTQRLHAYEAARRLHRCGPEPPRRRPTGPVGGDAAPMTTAAETGPTHMTAHPTNSIIARAGERTGAPQGHDATPASWAQVEDALVVGQATTWLSLRTDEGVHTRPVFAAWTGTSFVLASKARAVKTRHLETGTPCSLGIDLGHAHLVVEAVPARLTARADLQRASAAFAAVYDWPTSVQGEELDAPYAAPTSGGPPFRVYEFTPTRAFAFPTDDQFEPTRFGF